MDRIDRAVAEYRSVEEEARGKGPLHDLHPLSKLLVTVSYLVILLSFHRYDLEGVLMMGAYPVLLFAWGNVPVRPMWRRMRVILIPVCLVGIANPFFDPSGGFVSMASLLLKGLFAVAATYLLMVTTPMDDLCRALRKLRVPAVLVTVVLLIYRYLTVFLEEVARMRTAYSLRAPGQKGIHFRVWGPMVGMLLLRSVDRSESVYQGMVLRGFHGDFHYGREHSFSWKDGLYILLSILVSLLIRCL